MTGFLDGINESLKGYENQIETMDENTVVKIEIDPEKLYWNMVEAKADWLYNLPQWDAILTPEKRKELYRNQKASGTVRNEDVYKRQGERTGQSAGKLRLRRFNAPGTGVQYRRKCVEPPYQEEKCRRVIQENV